MYKFIIIIFFIGLISCSPKQLNPKYGPMQQKFLDTLSDKELLYFELCMNEPDPFATFLFCINRTKKFTEHCK